MNKTRNTIVALVLIALLSAGMAWYVFAMGRGAPKNDSVVVSGPSQGKARVALGELPKLVVDAIRKEVPEGVLRQAKKEMEDDQPVFDVDGTVKGLDFDMKVTPEGTVIEVNRELKAENLPTAITESLKQTAAGATIRGIERQWAKGRTIYEIKLTAEGRKLTLEFAEDGKLVRQKGGKPQPAAPVKT